MGSDVADVAIVGAGVAGAYAAWRLSLLRWNDFTGSARSSPLWQSPSGQRTNNQLKIHLYEQSDRIGGRLYSLPLRGFSKTVAELGGMRYYPTHRLVSSLIKKLKLPTKNFLAAPSDNFFYLRGQRLRQSQLSDAAATLYALSKAERGKTPAELILQTIDSMIPSARRNKGQSVYAWKRRWQTIKEEIVFNNKALYSLGFWNLLKETLSSEAYRYVLDAGGYSDNFENWNAADAMGWFVSDFIADESELKKENAPLALVDGFDRLPKILAGELSAQQSNNIFLNHQLVSFKKDRENPELLQLTFDDREQHRLVQIKARHLILAMPQRALQRLSQETKFFQSPQIQSDLASVFAEAAMKLFLGYKEAWWKSLDLHSGCSVSDLPIRLTYYGDALGELNALLLASYYYGDYFKLWGKAFDQAAPKFQSNHSIEPSYSEKLERAHLPSKELVERAQEQLRQLHGFSSDLPEPYTALVCDWGQDPYAGAWHLWKAGVKSQEVIPRVRRPRADYNVYICGEAYSNAQAWVEGALISAENLLQKIFRLPCPDWLPADYYLGP